MHYVSNSKETDEQTDCPSVSVRPSVSSLKRTDDWTDRRRE